MARKFSRTLLIAPTGGGKTTLLKQVAARRNNGSEYIFVTDFHRLYTCQKRFESAGDMLDFFEGDAPPGIYCADFGPVSANEEQWQDFFDIVDWVSGLSQKRKNYPVTLIVDEVIEFSTYAKVAACLERFIWYSRLAEVDLYFNTMAPQGLHRLIKINCNRLIIFAQHRRKDIKAIMDDSFLTDRDFADIQALTPFHWTEKTRLPVKGRHFLIFESATPRNRSGIVPAGSPRE